MFFSVYFILVTTFGSEASFYSEDKNMTFFKGDFNTSCPNTFPVHLCELKLLGNYKVFKFSSLVKKKSQIFL